MHTRLLVCAQERIQQVNQKIILHEPSCISSESIKNNSYLSIMRWIFTKQIHAENNNELSMSLGLRKNYLYPCKIKSQTLNFLKKMAEELVQKEFKFRIQIQTQLILKI